MSAEPFLIEERVDDFGTWTERWMCPPPPLHVGYQVIRQEWDDDLTVRTIHEIELAITEEA